MKKLTASDAEFADEFGWRVALSGDTIIVGAIGEDDNGSGAGAAYIFQQDQGGAENWGQVKVTASDADSFDRFGQSVALSGDTISVGAAEGQAGAAYVFQRNLGGADNWGEVKKLIASDAEPGDQFGYSVAIGFETAVIGANGEDAGGNAAGAAYIYERNQGGTDNWGEVKKLTASDAEANDDFGISAAVSGDVVLVGADGKDIPGGNAAGAAYYFQRDQGGAENWGEVSKLTASDAEGNDIFGVSVAVTNADAVVGAYFESGLAGAAYTYDLLRTKPTKPAPLPVGGISIDSDVRPLPVGTPQSSGRAWFLALIATTTWLAALGGAGLWARGRLG